MDNDSSCLILHQYKRAKLCPNFSTVCLVIETTLRLHNIPYKVKDNHKWNGITNNKLPRIKQNGQNITQNPLEYIFKTYKIDVKKDLSEKNAGLDLAFHALIEEILVPAIEIERYCFHNWNEYKQLVPPLVSKWIRFYNYYKESTI